VKSKRYKNCENNFNLMVPVNDDEYN
jgi:hypothetical protein